MNKLESTVKFGIYGFACIAAFFLLMKLFGLENVAFLRVFNLFIVVYFSNRLARLNRKEKPQIEYVSELGSLFIANVLMVVLSIVGFVGYVRFIDPAFLINFKGGLMLGNNISLDKAVAALFLEGMAGSIIVSFALMQYWKRDAKPKNSVPASKS